MKNCSIWLNKQLTLCYIYKYTTRNSADADKLRGAFRDQSRYHSICLDMVSY